LDKKEEKERKKNRAAEDPTKQCGESAPHYVGKDEAWGKKKSPTPITNARRKKKSRVSSRTKEERGEMDKGGRGKKNSKILKVAD